MDITILQALKDFIGINTTSYDFLIIMFCLFLVCCVFFSITNFFFYIVKYGLRG